jgi:uncharacterized surface protein with fasciclin (FAS1) repeats
MIHRLLTTAAVTFALAGAAMAQPAPAPAAPPVPAAAPLATVQLTVSGDLLGTLKASGQFTQVLKALDAANLSAFLKSPGPFTVFVPTDAAFAAMPAGQLDNLLQPANSAQLQALLAYHLIAADVPPAKIQGTKGPIATAVGTNVVVDGTSTPIHVNDADVVGQAKVSNGEIYVIDKVLTPPPLPAPAT